MAEAEKPTPPRKIRAQARETAGLLLIAAAILIFILIRYWGHIPWSAR